ncbi:MAG TPA: hypothetical protein VMJ11_24980, partial [Paraburkholderia sp.]|nr:hypothetical protein [Paraburkholderia sp.]
MAQAALGRRAVIGYTRATRAQERVWHAVLAGDISGAAVGLHHNNGHHENSHAFHFARCERFCHRLERLRQRSFQFGFGRRHGRTVSAASVMAGTVAVGAPMLNATVTILGASGQSVSASADAVNGTLSESGSELAIVLRKGTSTWALLGQENPYGITVGAAVERTLSVNAAQPQPTYTRNIAIDIPTSVPLGVMAPHAAKVYVHDNAGDGGWDTSAPIATLSDSGCTGQQSLTITGNVCGGEWLSLDSF